VLESELFRNFAISETQKSVLPEEKRKKKSRNLTGSVKMVNFRESALIVIVFATILEQL
jgi:hypothetical protein